RYGKKYYSQTEECKQKIKCTNFDKYGTEHYLKTKEGKEKIKQTNLKKYGVKYVSQNPDVRKKQINSCLKKYGVPYSIQNEMVKLKSKQTCLKKYGTEYYLKTEECRKKSKQTCLKKYGVDHPMKDKEIALKSVRAQNNSYILFNWKTGEETICTASYEKKVVEYLNKNKIEFEWQTQVFIMPNGKTYRPDLYLVIEDKWVEIKGYFREKNRVKWEWFSGKYPNSELWDKNILNKMGIL
ncbi:hypothetical protein LCGC14_2237140, partial [marine sediment metagenome]